MASAIAGGSIAAMVGAINEIQAWGFNGRKLQPSIKPDKTFLSELPKAFEIWSSDPSDSQNKIEALERLLSVKGLGIATISKWLCFTRPKQLAIYDSRVSIALRPIVTNGQRIFPTVGRRNTKTRKYPPADYQSLKPEIMAARYHIYTNMLACVVDNKELMTASDVEMALFMLGDNI